MNTPMMKCGHAANAVNSATGALSCIICVGLTPDAEQISAMPNLSGRTAYCAYVKTCDATAPSSTDLAFFEYLPTESHDLYYCGCHGWD